MRSPFFAPDGFLLKAANQVAGGFTGKLHEQVVEGDLAVDEVDGVFVWHEAIGGNHHGLDEDSFLDGITQYVHLVSD